MDVTCDCGTFDSCPADKIGLCWKGAEHTIVGRETWEHLTEDN